MAKFVDIPASRPSVEKRTAMTVGNRSLRVSRWVGEDS